MNAAPAPPAAPPSFLDRLAQGLMAFVFSIRFRIALWFTLALGISLALFGAFIYAREARATQAEAGLRVSARARLFQDYLQRGGYEADDDHPAPTAGSLALQENEILLLVDGRGRLLQEYGSLSAADRAALVNQAVSDAAATASPAPFRYDLASGRERAYVFSAAPLLREGRVAGLLVLGQPEDPGGALPRLLLTLLGGAALMVLLATAGGYLLADRALAPVDTITRAARQISDGDLNRRIRLNSKDELGRLASTFDGMLDRLQAAFQRQRQFTADASHELRTPLTIIGLEVDRALSEGPRPAEERAASQRKALEVVKSENEFMTRLVGELLTLARMDSSPGALKRECLDLADVTLEVVERFLPVAQRKGVALVPGSLPEVMVTGDRQYLAQMVANLVDNAIKYTPGGPGQTVRAEVGLEGEWGWVRVSDTGPGIPPDHLPKLFDRFYRVDEARSHNPAEAESPGGPIPGSGLGLAIVQRIAQLHGGAARVESAVGRGAVFTVMLPRG